MRPYLYILAGITSALLGWNIGQVFLSDLGWLKSFREVVLFPCIAISLAIGSVANEIFVSNPTRPQLSLRMLRIPLLIALGVGLVSGLVAGGISQILFAPQIKVPAFVVRIFGWLVVGASVGVAEGLSWRWHSLEAGNPKRFRQRLILSIIAASLASAIAASIFELIRQTLGTMPVAFKPYEDPLGFAVLGLCLGIAFSITNLSPSYIPALRAGKGFEYKGEDYGDIDPQKTIKLQNYPRIDRALVKFISYRSQAEEEAEDEIEEGISIELPVKGIIRVGSAPVANLCLPHLPLHAADIKLAGQKAVLIPNAKSFYTVAINGTRLGTRRNVSLKHNYVITFYTVDKEDIEAPKCYRLVFYNRFLDPMA
ncbi:hypothetical protein [Phormidium sp. CCY1219]|uniref:hypothetical protein n=1 Tax=Phormidium sp. CCY1219 TaxID=2886104 RepID=UPI002D1F2E10|nr:hypothetical protein [Phormidium sp. CCY1219]MEB3827022.1 hypothetical protein [Phormidium sp. CCY1219]